MGLRIDTLVHIAREAGELAVDHFGRVKAERKKDGTLVTEGDRAVQRLIVERLREVVPDPRQLFILAEEDDGTDLNPGVEDPLRAAQCVAVDPIDGTSSFAAGLPLWCISLGLLGQGRPVAGVVFVPLLGGPDGWLYQVDEEGPARRNGEEIRVMEPEPWYKFSQVLVPSEFQRWARLEGYPGKMRSLGSIAHHLALVASGVVCGTVVGTARAWDLAAGAALLERAGGKLISYSGSQVDWATLLRQRSMSQVLFAGPSGVVERLAARVVFSG